MAIYTGECHCGAIGFRFSTDTPPCGWPIRACQCAFCRAHCAACASDPLGQVAFVYAEEAKLQRYRFALRTADFLVCRNCGVYIGAVLNDAPGAFATLNTRAIASLYGVLPDPQPTDYGHESADGRRQRRRTRWTPVVESV